MSELPHQKDSFKKQPKFSLQTIEFGFVFFFLMVLLSGEVKKDLHSLPSTPLFAAEMARSSCCVSVFLLLEATWWWEFLRLFPVFKLGIKGFAV